MRRTEPPHIEVYDMNRLQIAWHIDYSSYRLATCTVTHWCMSMHDYINIYIYWETDCIKGAFEKKSASHHKHLFVFSYVMTCFCFEFWFTCIAVGSSSSAAFRPERCRRRWRQQLERAWWRCAFYKVKRIQIECYRSKNSSSSA